MGLHGLEMIMVFLGIAPSYGSGDKWSRMFNALGSAEEAICNEVALANPQEEIRLTKEHAEVDLSTWMETNYDATGAEKQANLNSLLMMEGDKVGIAIGADGQCWAETCHWKEFIQLDNRSQLRRWQIYQQNCLVAVLFQTLSSM